MSIGNSSFRHPSTIENCIYELMENPKYIASLDAYTTDLETAVIDIFENEFPNIEWQYFTTIYPDASGGSAALSWIENGHLHMIGWDYTYAKS